MLKVTKKNDKFKQGLVISVMLHVTLFALPVWNILNKYVEILKKSDSEDKSIINTIMVVDPKMTELKYYHQQQKQTNVQYDKEQNVKQTFQKQHLRQLEKERVKVQEVARKEKLEEKKQTKEVAKKIQEQHKIESTVRTRQEIIESQKKSVIMKGETVDINELFSDLSSKKNAPKNIDRIKRDDLLLKEKDFIQNRNDGTLDTDVKDYARQIREAIESHFYDASSYSGKICTLKIKLAPDGMLLDIQSEGGDPILCTAALTAARQAKIPKPPSKRVYEIFKNIPLDFKP